MEQSGKQTLLQRLEGKDPFVSAIDDHSERTGIVAPYKPPPDHQVWDRIQLRVSVSRSVDSSSCNHLDFAVILIDPRHDVDRLRDYLDETIRALLCVQGHQSSQDDDSTQDVDLDESTVQRPVCLCLLLNFRDLKSSADQWLEESDIQALTMEVLQNFPSLEPSRLVLQCGSTSLLNCYGLNVLHHFIYQCYLQRKRCDLERYVDQVREEQAASRNAPSLSYEQFLKIAQSGDSSRPAAILKKPKKSKKERKKHTAVNEVEHAGTARIRHAEGGAGSTDNDAQSEAIEEPLDYPVGRRRIIPNGREDVDSKVTSRLNGSSSEQPDRPSFTGTKQALEAFLASDDEDQDPAGPPRQSIDASESENEDDDYFYDESGRRNKMQSVSEEEPEKRTQASKPKPTVGKSHIGRAIGGTANNAADASQAKAETSDRDAEPDENLKLTTVQAEKGSTYSTTGPHCASSESVSGSESKSDSSEKKESESSSQGGAERKETVDGDRLSLAESEVALQPASTPANESESPSGMAKKSPAEVKGNASHLDESDGSKGLDAVTLEETADSENSTSPVEQDAPSEDAKEVKGVSVGPEAGGDDYNDGDDSGFVVQETRSASPVSTKDESETSGGSNGATVHEQPPAVEPKIGDGKDSDEDGIAIEQITSVPEASASTTPIKPVDKQSTTAVVDADRKDDSDSVDSSFVIHEMPPTVDSENEEIGGQDDDVDNDVAAVQSGHFANMNDDSSDDDSKQDTGLQVTSDASAKDGTASESKTAGTDNKGALESGAGLIPLVAKSQSPQSKDSLPEATPTADTPPGLSAAARAAIAAAQLDFERMVHEPRYENAPEVAAKKPKKKKKESKDGDKKKKKKDKKAKRSKAEESPTP